MEKCGGCFFGVDVWERPLDLGEEDDPGLMWGSYMECENRAHDAEWIRANLAVAPDSARNGRGEAAEIYHWWRRHLRFVEAGGLPSSAVATN